MDMSRIRANRIKRYPAKLKRPLETSAGIHEEICHIKHEIIRGLVKQRMTHKSSCKANYMPVHFSQRIKRSNNYVITWGKISL